MPTNLEHLMSNPAEAVEIMKVGRALCIAKGITPRNLIGPVSCDAVSCSECIDIWLSEECKETVKDIKKDAGLTTSEYWKCEGYVCSKCPLEDKPKLRYNTPSCSDAKVLDIIARCEKALGA